MGKTSLKKLYMNKYTLFLCLFAISCKSSKLSNEKSKNIHSKDSSIDESANDTLSNAIKIGGDRAPKDYFLIDDSLLLIGNKNGVPIYDTIRNGTKKRY